jgi:hypothetical protein
MHLRLPPPRASAGEVLKDLAGLVPIRRTDAAVGAEVPVGDVSLLITPGKLPFNVDRRPVLLAAFSATVEVSTLDHRRIGTH